MLGSENRLETLVTGRSVCFRNQTRQHHDLRLDVEPLVVNRLAHRALQGPDLVQDVNDLPARIRLSEDIGLPEETVRRDDGDRENHRHARQEAFEVARGRGLEDVEQKLHHLANLLRFTPPTRLEAQASKLAVELGAFFLVALEDCERTFERVAELVEVPKRPVEHQLLSAHLVDLQEIEKELLSATAVHEETARQVPVQKLDAPTDVARVFELREAALERAQVDFEDVPVAGRNPSGEPLLDVEEFGHAQLATVHVLGVHLHVLPTPHPRPHRKTDEGFVDDGFLRVPDDRRHRRISQRRTDVGVGELLELVLEIRPK